MLEIITLLFDEYTKNLPASQAGPKPGFDNLVKLADCFQVSMDYLAGRSESRETLP